MFKLSAFTSLFLVSIALISCAPNETSSLLKDKENLSMTILRLKQQNEELTEEISAMTAEKDSKDATIATLQQKQDKLLQDYSRISEDFRKKTEELERLKQNSSSSRAIFEPKSASNKH
jgi:chromosome segregation ATPase